MDDDLDAYGSEIDSTSDLGGAPGADTSEGPTNSPDMKPDDLALLAKLRKRIKADKRYHKDAFSRMRRDMKLARHGKIEKEWSDKKYTANIIGRHISQKTNALYAKNPKAVSRRRETLDFSLWDENQSSLMLAYQTLQSAQQAGALAQAMQSGQAPAIDQMGQPLPAPQAPQGFAQAQQLFMDFQQGMMRREQVKKIGKTLEILFAQAMREQKPLDFKAGMKRVVQRACTVGVGYVKVGFQRKMGPRMGLNEALADAQERLAHLQALQVDIAEGQMDDDTQAEQAEIEASIAALQNEPETVLREGLVFDYPLATRVVPDKVCRGLIGFVASSHLTLEYLYTKDQVQEVFKVKLDKFTEYTSKGMTGSADDEQMDLPEVFDKPGETRREAYALVWEHYDKSSGLVYWMADGYEGWLRAPAAPDVVVDDFWPVYAVTFNETEDEDEIFPLSDTYKLMDMQSEYNRSREGKRMHRRIAIPRFLAATGVLDEQDEQRLASAEPFSVTTVNAGGGDMDLRKLIVAVPVPGVDPNLYDTGEIMGDMQYVVGAQSASMGGTSKATATESAIAASASASTDTASVDELDAFLTNVVRASGQVLMANMTEEQVVAVVGPGAVWPQQSMQDIAEALFLEIEAGSTGRPNQAIEIQNWTNMLPFLLQMKGIDPVWLARESLRRLDDKMDLTEAIVSEVPSMIAQNRADAAPQQQGGPPPPGAPKQNFNPGGVPPQIDPGQASGIPTARVGGADNGPQPPADVGAGSGPAFGSNQV